MGYVPPKGTPIIEKARQRGVAFEDLVNSGIVGNNERGTYELFRGRIIFPLADAHGSVVGLAGRILKENPERPVGKYINTPETLLYHKSRLLYGLDKAREAIRKNDLAIVAEGYTDVIASHQTEIANVVATSGTAFTSEHVEILKRFTENLAFAFDADAAGALATRRALEQAIASGVSVSVVVLPSGKDPADLAIENKAKWQEAIKNREDAFVFLLKKAAEQDNVAELSTKKKITRDFISIIAKVPEAVVRGEYIKQLASVLKTETRYLYEDLERVQHGRSEQPASAEEKQKAPQKDPLIAKEERLLTLLLAAPQIFSLADQNLEPEHFTAAHTRGLYKSMKGWYGSYHTKEGVLDFSGIPEHLPEDLRQQIQSYYLAIEVEREENNLGNPDREARALIRELLVTNLKRKLQEVTHQLQNPSTNDRTELMQKAHNLNEKITQAEQLNV